MRSDDVVNSSEMSPKITAIKGSVIPLNREDIDPKAIRTLILLSRKRRTILKVTFGWRLLAFRIETDFIWCLK